MKYPILCIAAIVLLAAAPFDPPATATAPPSPPPLNDTQASPAPADTLSPALPSATPTPNLDTIFGTPQNSPGPRHGRERGNVKAPAATPQPRKGLDGVWEIQIQRGPNTEYEHMKLVQTGQDLSGIFLTKDNKKYPVVGSVDPQSNIRLVVSLPDGSTILLSGRVDGTTDMLGMFTDAKESVPFTAAYRPKENWMENINATPGGLGTGTGSGP
ncbi:MAG TPA: hypothetical protein VMD47_12580 [Candidatus Acidoferrales bacterium]|nr:hypothetical protein [Candidatus Acidoferrales bacterium]